MNPEISQPKGIYYDRIVTAQGKIIESGWRSNIIVDHCRLLLAAFITRDKLKARGIKYLCIGKGDESWDTESLPPPLRSTEQLTDSNPFEIQLKPAMIKYLDVTGNPTSGPTHRIQIKITLKRIGSDGGTYPLREFGLFGEFDNKKYMIDYVRHPVIHKAADDTMVRIIRLMF